MERRLSQSKPLKLLKNEKWKPYIRYQKETDTWVAKAIRKERSGNEKMEETMEELTSKIRILMERGQLDIIARIVAYLYHDKIDDYKEIASDLRKEHIYKDLRSIDQWLNIQYDRLKTQEKKDEKFNLLTQEILDE